ncbi:MAG: TonB-dependent receptor [Calditrichaceae bacterium]|nr:TonB-dependent receptor [Calditrichaceae bacterium]
MKFFSKTIFTLIYLSFLVSHLHSQTGDTLTVYQSEEIVVTATRSDQKVSDVTRSLSVITKDQIDNSVYLSPADVLSQQEGMSFIGIGQTPGSAQSVFTRGVNSNSTAVLIDGMRISDPSSIEDGVNLSELSLTDINQIEVVRGAHSTMYGSSAIGGVINFISEKNHKAGFNAEFSNQVGTFGSGTSLFSQDLFLNYTFMNGFYFNGEILNSKVNGLNATVDNTPDSLKFRKPDRDDFSKLEGMVKAGFINNDLDLFFSYRNMNQKADIDDGAFDDDDNAWLKYDRDIFTYNSSFRINNAIQLKFNIGYSKVKRRAENDSSLVDNLGNYDRTFTSDVFKGTTLNPNIVLSYNLNYLDIQLGAELYRETMTSDNYIYSNSIWGLYEARTSLDSLDLHTNSKSSFLHFDLNGGLIGKRYKSLNLAIGGRYINHSAYGDVFTYDINPSYKLGKNLFYGSVSTGYNAPSLYRLYAPNSNFISGITRGNPNLKPEKSNSFEIGYRYTLNRDNSFFISVFENKISNIHEYVYLWNSNTPIDSLSFLDDRGDTYINAGTMIIKGFEVGFSMKILETLLLRGNASWNDGRQEYSINDIDAKHTQGNHVQVYNNGRFVTGNYTIKGLNRRFNTMNISLVYSPFNNFSVTELLHYAGKRDDIYYNTAIEPYGALDRVPLGDYVLIDLSAMYQVIDPLKITIRVENLMNKKYSEIRGYNTKGRSFYLGLRYVL